MADTKQSPIPTISAETEILCNRLAKLAPGESVSYDELSKIIRQNVRGVAAHTLASARRKARHDHGVVLVTIRTQGVKRAKGLDYDGITKQATASIRRKARKALKESLLMPQEEFAELPNAGKVALNTSRSMLGVIDHASSPQVYRKIEATPQVQNGRLAIGEVLALASGEAME